MKNLPIFLPQNLSFPHRLSDRLDPIELVGSRAVELRWSDSSYLRFRTWEKTWWKRGRNVSGGFVVWGWENRFGGLFRNNLRFIWVPSTGRLRESCMPGWVKPLVSRHQNQLTWYRDSGNGDEMVTTSPEFSKGEWCWFCHCWVTYYVS